MICFNKKVWLIVLVSMLFLITFPTQPLSKQSKASVKGKPFHKVQAKKAAEASQETSGGLHCNAKAAVLMDGLTGQILYEQDPNLRIAPASFVKVMTLYVVFDAIRAGQMKMDDMATVSEKAWRRTYKSEGSSMFLNVGERVKVEDLIKGVTVASGNDACVALAEQLAGSEDAFVSKMNEKARALGLKDTQYKNSDGGEADGQYITAMEMAILSKRYIEDHPEALAFHSTAEYEHNGIKQGNRNTLLSKNIGVDGLKTGHLREAGYHLDATAKREAQRMIAVVMGCSTIHQRTVETQKLLEYGFKNFSTVEAVKKDAPFGPVRVKRGKLNQIILIAAEAGRVTVARGKENLVSAIPQLPESVAAPIQKGQILAKVVLQNEGKVVKEVNLLSSSDIKKSLIPPWPVLLGILFGMIIIAGIISWRLRKPRQRRL